MIGGFLNYVIIQEEILSSSICGFQRHFECVGWQKCRQHRSYMGGFFFSKQPERNIKMYITCTLFPLPRPIQMTACNCTGGWEMQFKLYQQEGKRTGLANNQSISDSVFPRILYFICKYIQFLHSRDGLFNMSSTI